MLYGKKARAVKYRIGEKTLLGKNKKVYNTLFIMKSYSGDTLDVAVFKIFSK